MDIENPIWRLNNLYKVIDKSGQKVQFKQNTVQVMLNGYTQKRRRILKARQMGVSTNELLKQLDYVLFNRNKTALILAHDQDSIQKLFRIVRRAYDFLSEDLKPELDRGGGSRYELFFPSINSRIYCDLSSRGDTINFLHISEKAFIEDIGRVYATTECVPIDGIITEESTANGMNHFYDSWVESDSNYTNIFFPWFLMPEYSIANNELKKTDLTDDENNLIKRAKKDFNIDLTLSQIAFRRFKQRELKSVFLQEYAESEMSCFLTSGNNPFTLEIIKEMYDKAPNPKRVHNGIKIFEEQKNNEVYVIGADTAEGFGGDSSVCHVFKVSNREQVATFASNKLKPGEFGEKLDEIGRMYKVKMNMQEAELPMIGVERNNHGHAVILKLDEILQYPNLFKHTQDSEKIGWITDKVTRPIMMNSFIEGVENGTVKLNDRETLSECMTLVNNNGKIEAETSKHDDRVIAAAISLQLCIEEFDVSLYSNIDQLIKT